MSSEPSPPQGGQSEIRSSVSTVFKNVVLPFLTVVTPFLIAGLTLFVGNVSDNISKEIAQVDAEIKRLEAERLDRESLQEYNIIVLKEVKESLTKKDPAIQVVVIGLLNSMPNQELAQTWLKALEGSKNTTEDNKVAAKNIRQTIEYDQEQKILSVSKASRTVLANEPPTDWEDYDYDIFWCEESSPKAKQYAGKIVQTMRNQGAKGRLRVRMLPVKVNARSGYGIKGYEIRRNTNELQEADALKGLGDEVIKGAGVFELKTSNQATPYYLSAFICPQAN